MTLRYNNLIVNSAKYSYITNKLRDFFNSKGMIECHAQNRLSILSACENTESIVKMKYAGKIAAYPQTNQMWLEYELLTNPKPFGYYVFTTSYRNEQNPIPGRHQLIFPMTEFEIKTDYYGMKQFEKEMIRALGYNGHFAEGNFNDVAKKFNTDDIKHEHEQQIYKSGNPVFFLKNFPPESMPFWNMSRNPDGTAKKIDIIMAGQETVGSSERDTDKDKMRHRFQTISNGEYAGLLYKMFGQKAVDEELDEFLSHNFFIRSGGGIGMTRLMNFFEQEKLYPKEVEDMSRVD